jgi:signal transduction histidine kinase
VLLGLIGNAAAVVPAGGEIVLEAASEPAGVAFAVADSGPGVPLALRERIFEPFFTTRPAGTGLGLAVAREIVRAHAGSIEVGERPGGGARFVVHLPAHGSLPEAA